MMPSITTDEFRARYSKAQKLITEKKLDALLVNSNEAECANVRYFSNYWPIFETAGVVIPPTGEGALLIGPESRTFAEDRSVINRIRLMKEYREPADPDYPNITVATFTEVFRECGIKNPKRIGIAGYLVTTLPMIEGLKSAFPDAEIVRADDIMIALRSVKSPAEIACLSKAFEIAEDAIGVILDQIKPGMTELSIVGIAQRAIYERGAEAEGMPQYVFSGKNTTHAISRPTHKLIEKNEMIQLNISARVSGYSSGVGRPLCLGKMSAPMKDLVTFALDAHKKTASWMKAGVCASDVATKYQSYFKENGHEEHFLYGPCHGLGMIEVEPPWMETTSNYALQKNMTFNIDTFAFRNGEFGLRWENGAVVTEKGVDLLSTKYMDILER